MPARLYLSISIDHMWKSCGNHMVSDHILKSCHANNPNVIVSTWTALNNQMLCGNTLYTELLSQSILAPLSTKLWFLQLLFLCNTIAHGCPDVTAHAIAHRWWHQPNIQYLTPVQDITTSPAWKWGLEKDSNNENQLPGSLSPLKLKPKYKKQQTLIRNFHDILKVIHEADCFVRFLVFCFPTQGY
jgi:hypothetical protein